MSRSCLEPYSNLVTIWSFNILRRGTDVTMIFWQIYGNIIYWEWRGATPESDSKFSSCMDTNNHGLLFCMIMILLVGYFFLIAAVAIASLFIYTYYLRYRNRKSAMSASKKIIKALHKQKYSVERFGEIKDENECIICMSSYTEKDVVTCLKCNDQHFFHHECILNWIKMGKNQCPMCREPIHEGL